MDEDEMETGLLGNELDCMDEIDVSIQNVPALAQESDGAMMVLQPSCCHNAFTEWSEYSKRRLDAQVQAMRLLQTGQNVPASLMISSGGRQEHLTRCPDLDTTPPMDSLQSRMEWLQKASHESFWTLPPHLAQDLATVAASRDANSYDRGRANSRGPLTVASERRWRAELRMREAEARMEAQRRARDTSAQQNSSEGTAAGEGGGGERERAGHAGGRGVSGESDREPTAERQQIELLSLRLRGIQRRLRAAVVEAHPLSGIPGPDVCRFMQREAEAEGDDSTEALPEMWQALKEEEQKKLKAERHARYLESVLATHRKFSEWHKERRLLLARLCKDIQNDYRKRERRKEAQMQKAKRDRLAALKSDDISSYRKHILDSKNERMKTVVTRMDEYMEKLGANISKQTAEAAESIGKSIGKEMDLNAAKEYVFAMPINEKITAQSSLMGLGDAALKLKAYQVEGVNWLVNLYNNNMSGILADEMGLGKTIQVIGMICHLMEHKNNAGPYLVIAPLSTISNWQAEFERWAPSVTAIVYRGNPAERKVLFNEHMKDGKFNVLIVQFELVMDKQDAKRLKTLNWSYVIVDEGHRLKNRESKLFSVLTGKNGYKAKNRVILSGTPLQNEIHELWSLLNFLLPEVFDTNDDFEEWFAKPFKTQEASDDVEVDDEEKEFLIKSLHAVLRPFMTRRLKADLKDIMELPETREATIWCELSALQKILYLQTEHHLLMKQDAEGGAKTSKMTNRISQLRKVCNHPFLFEEYCFGDEYLVRCCGKLSLLDRILPKMQRGGHRVLIYSQMVKLLHILKVYCEIKGYNHMVLSGETASDERIELMRKWNAPNSQYFIFMLSTRAGGQGINLQTADTVIIYDSDWNPMMDEQAKARVHRLGQKKQTLVLRLVTPNTVEEKVNNRAQARLQNEDLAIEAGKFNQRTDVAESHEILKEKLAKEFKDKMEKAKEQAHTDEQINELIARTPEEIELFNRMDTEERAAEEKRIRRGGLPGPARLMTEDEVPSWLQGEAILLDDRVQCLSDQTSADLAAGEGQTGVVIAVPSATNPNYLIKLDNIKEGPDQKEFPRSRLRPVTNDSQDRYRQDLGFGRGQRVSREVDRPDKVDLSKMTDAQFDKHMRASDKAEDEADAARKKKKQRKLESPGNGAKAGNGANTGGRGTVSSPVSPGEALAAVTAAGGAVRRSPEVAQIQIPKKSGGQDHIPKKSGGQDPMNSKKKAKVEARIAVQSTTSNSKGEAPLQIPKKASSQNPAVLEMDRNSQGNGQETEEWEGGAESGGRHRKYDPVAKAPWRGGEVKPYLYGRKVVFVLKGKRGEPITR